MSKHDPWEELDTLTQPKPTRVGVYETPEGPAFDVTQVLGTVHLGNGGPNARAVAFAMIGESGQCGVFQFPSENGGTVIVSVDETNA